MFSDRLFQTRKYLKKRIPTEPSSHEQASSVRIAFIGLLTAVIVGLLVRVAFDDSLGEAALTAGAIGIGVAIGTYIFTSQME